MSDSAWRFAHPTVLAPMEGVTHPLFRALTAARGGVGLVCTEFVRIGSTPLAEKALRREVVRCADAPLSVQVMGREVGPMTEAARVIAASHADVVDINMGCPTRNALKGGVGAAMLRDPKLVYEVVSAMREATAGLLSVKMRAGFDNPAHVLELASNIQRAGADFVAIHPRLRVDHYEGVADWRIIGAVKRELRIPVVGNGDCWYAADALRMERETGCDAVMFGRSALRNPWIFVQVQALRAGLVAPSPTGRDLATHIEQLADAFTVHHGRAALGLLKEQVRWLGRTVGGGRVFLRAALRSASVAELVALSQATLAFLPASALDLGPEGNLRLERSGSAAQA